MAPNIHRLTMNKFKIVGKFWDENLCGKHFIREKFLSEKFFGVYRQFRYKKEHHLNSIIEWHYAKGKNVLEIGVGLGADATRWAEYAKNFIGIDLSFESTKASKLHLEFLGLKGLILQSNVEFVPFHDNEFDIIYSHGVLHHTPDIRKALEEINRILKNDGILILMLYTKNSFNYWIRIQLLFRILFMFQLSKYKLGLNQSSLWKIHIFNYYKYGRSYLSWEEWPHHCTDGPDCEIANIYYKNEIKKLLKESNFVIKKMKKAHFPLGGRFPNFEFFLARYLGFYQFIWATKR